MSKYAFIVHPRYISDYYRKFPFMRFLPDFIIYNLAKMLPPIKVSKITGLRSLVTGQVVDGYIVSIPFTAEMMLLKREVAVDKIVAAIKYAKNDLGCDLVGLGGLTSSLSHGGKLLEGKVNCVCVTTGHAYTGYNVTQNVFAIFKRLNLKLEESVVAIVGATGSVGSISAEILARAGVRNFILVDITRKEERFKGLADKILSYNYNCKIKISTSIDDIKNSTVVITATNAKEALITNAHVRPGLIIVDDAQPSDVSDEVLAREDVLVVEAGVVHTPGIFSNFNLGLKNAEDNFCCMAELLILASNEYKDHYVIERPTLEKVDEIVEMSKGLNFSLGSFQNRRQKVSSSDIDNFSKYLSR